MWALGRDKKALSGSVSPRGVGNRDVKAHVDAKKDRYVCR